MKDQDMTDQDPTKQDSQNQSTLTPNYSPLVFFGSSEMSVKVLEAMDIYDIKIDLVITVPDKPQGRKLALTPNPTKIWAMNNKIPHLEFAKLDDEAFKALQQINISHDKQTSLLERPKLFIVASYGKIIPERFLEIPEFGALNVHPSKLPELRGASPLQSTILADQHKTAVTIIKMDKEMDHGPIFDQRDIDVAELSLGWPVKYSELEDMTAYIGVKLIKDSLNSYINGTLKLKEQDHSKATFTKKIIKEDGLIDPWTMDPIEQRKNLLKIKAFEEWPRTYFFIDKITKGENKNIRVIVKDAEWQEEGPHLKITKVVPEGGKEMSWESFLQSIGKR